MCSYIVQCSGVVKENAYRQAGMTMYLGGFWPCHVVMFGLLVASRLRIFVRTIYIHRSTVYPSIEPKTCSFKPKKTSSASLPYPSICIAVLLSISKSIRSSLSNIRTQNMFFVINFLLTDPVATQPLGERCWSALVCDVATWDYITLAYIICSSSSLCIIMLLMNLWHVCLLSSVDELGFLWPPRCVSDALEGITFLPLAFWLWVQETGTQQGGV